MSEPVLHRLSVAQAPAYRDLMLQAYARHPEAFTSTAEERASLPLRWWEDRLREAPGQGDAVFGVWSGPQLIGAAGLQCELRERTRHKATLFGMVVLPEWRGRGLGRQLVQAVLRHAARQPGLRVVQLSVSEGNAGAQALYAGCGFERWGREPLAVALAGGGYLTKLHMACVLPAG